MIFTRVATIGLFLLTGYLIGQNTAEVHSVRLESSVSGHIHPAICVCKSGTLVAVFCKSEFKPDPPMKAKPGPNRFHFPTPPR